MKLATNGTISRKGNFDKTVDKHGNEYIKNPNTFHTSDYGDLYRNTTIKMIRDKFGAEMKHKESGNVLIFDTDHFVKIGKIYDETGLYFFQKYLPQFEQMVKTFKFVN